MRILFVGQHFPRPNNPTIGTWALSQLKALQQLGHEVRVISPVALIPRWVRKALGRGSSADCPRFHDWDGIQACYPKWSIYPVGPLHTLTRRYPGPFIALGWLQIRREVRQWAREFAPDVIFAHHAAFGGAVAAKLSHELGVPWYVTDHDYEELTSCRTNWWRRTHYRRVLRTASHWFAVSNAMRDLMAEIFPEVPSSTLHNGADEIPAAMFQRPRPAEFAGCKLVFCAGFFYQRKNMPLAVRAFDEAADQHPDALLVLAGGGDTEAEVVRAIAQAKHRDRIRFVGRLDHAAVLQHMVWADIFLSLGEREPFGVVFAEAMMAGTPIIYATDGGISDLAISGQHGIGVKPGDLTEAAAALDRMMSDPDDCKRMASQARALGLGRLSWGSNAIAFAQICGQPQMKNAQSGGRS